MDLPVYNRYLSEKRKKSEGKDYLNPKQVYAPFKSCNRSQNNVAHETQPVTS